MKMFAHWAEMNTTRRSVMWCGCQSVWHYVRWLAHCQNKQNDDDDDDYDHHRSDSGEKEIILIWHVTALFCASFWWRSAVATLFLASPFHSCVIPMYKCTYKTKVTFERRFGGDRADKSERAKERDELSWLQLADVKMYVIAELCWFTHVCDAFSDCISFHFAEQFHIEPNRQNEESVKEVSMKCRKKTSRWTYAMR